MDGCFKWIKSGNFFGQSSWKLVWRCLYHLSIYIWNKKNCHVWQPWIIGILPRPLDLHSRALLYVVTSTIEGRKESSPFFHLFYLLYYSARGGIFHQGCQNAYNSGLPSAAIFFILYIYLCQFSWRLTEKNTRLYSFKASVHSFLVTLYMLL